MQRRLIKLAVPVLLGSLALAACGDKKEETAGPAGGATKVVKIGFIAPTSGDLSDLGNGMKNAVDLAIRQANEQNKVQGWRIEFAPEDDAATADVGAQAATKLTSDAAVVAVVGTLNSSVAQQVQPILDNANILMVSPANTNPTLTQGEDPNNKKRAYKTYFRTATTDAIQGPFAARYVLNELKLKRIAVVHDKKTYGQGLTEAFKAEFTAAGGTILGTETVNPDEKDFSAVISKLRPLNPELVYYGGEHPAAAPLSQQMKLKGLRVPLMGGDGIFSGTYITNGKKEVEGDLSTSVGAPTESLESAKSFVADYKAAGYKEPFEAYGAYAYDAANAIINAMAKVLPGKDSINVDVKKALVEAMGDVSFSGVTGEVAFDEFGDTKTKVLTVYKVTGGKWVPAKTDEFE